jgi:hypothetical protein
MNCQLKKRKERRGDRVRKGGEEGRQEKRRQNEMR